MGMATDEGWVDVADVAAHLRVNKDSIYRWVHTKGFPAHRIGRLLHFRLSEVDERVNTTSAKDSDTDPITRRRKAEPK